MQALSMAGVFKGESRIFYGLAETFRCSHPFRQGCLRQGVTPWINRDRSPERRQWL
jgi:hypothetical protein